MILNFLIFLSSFTLSDSSKLSWTTPQSHDFGEILRGSTHTHVFEFKNLTDKPLTIDNVRTDCGCTASDWEEEPVKPKALGKINITFDGVKSGYFKKKITVWVKGQKQAEKLSIEGEVL
jgi:Protein of unknown function (DUF1573)